MRDPMQLKMGVEFAYLAKYEGDRGARPAATGAGDTDRLNALQADLADPACIEIVVFGDAFPTQHWRK